MAETLTGLVGILRFHADESRIFDKSNDTVVVKRHLLTEAADALARAHLEARESDGGFAPDIPPLETAEFVAKQASVIAAKEAELSALKADNERLRISLSNMLEDGDETDRQEAITLLGKAT